MELDLEGGERESACEGQVERPVADRRPAAGAESECTSGVAAAPRGCFLA